MLPLILQHSATHICCNTLCSLLQVSRTCRQTVRQSRAHAVVHNGVYPALKTLLGLSRFAAWLGNGHAGLVSELILYSSVAQCAEADQPSTEVIQNMLVLALRSAALAASAAAADAADCAGQAMGNILQAVPLQLKYFSTNYLVLRWSLRWLARTCRICF